MNSTKQIPCAGEKTVRKGKKLHRYIIIQIDGRQTLGCDFVKTSTKAPFKMPESGHGCFGLTPKQEAWAKDAGVSLFTDEQTHVIEIPEDF